LKILITGAGGLVGRSLVEYCRAKGDEVLDYDHSGLDIVDADQVEALITRGAPDAVINCAAWTDVDGCESDPQRAEAVNALGPANLARASRQVNAVLVTISTDYVFDGRKQGFYTQRDNPHPISVYGHFKLDGERRAQLEHARTVVVRTGFIFGPGGRNFLSRLVEQARRGEELKAIRDVHGTPTYSLHLAARLRELADLDLPGIFHVVNSGDGASYEDFARLALELAKCPGDRLHAVGADSLNRPAPRPRNSKLRCLLSEAIGLAPLPPWQEGLGEFISPKMSIYTETSGIRV
jgi:dTDP-4-dehydrorhamnose reductase